MSYSCLPITPCLYAFIYLYIRVSPNLSTVRLKLKLDRSPFRFDEVEGKGVKRSIRAASIQRDGSSIDDNRALQQSNRKLRPPRSRFSSRATALFFTRQVFLPPLPASSPFLLPIRCSSGDCIVTPLDRGGEEAGRRYIPEREPS